MITRPTNGSKEIHFLDQDGQEEKDLITSLTNALSCKYAMLPNCLCPQLVGRAAAEPALGPRAWPSDSPIAAGRARHCCHYARASFSKLIQCILCMFNWSLLYALATLPAIIPILCCSFTFISSRLHFAPCSPKNCNQHTASWAVSIEWPLGWLSSQRSLKLSSPC